MVILRIIFHHAKVGYLLLKSCDAFKRNTQFPVVGNHRLVRRHFNNASLRTVPFLTPSYSRINDDHSRRATIQNVHSIKHVASQQALVAQEVRLQPTLIGIAIEMHPDGEYNRSCR